MEHHSRIIDIQKIVCEEYGVTMRGMLSKSRERHLVIPRMVAMGLVREMTNMSLYGIAKKFNRVNHTTVIHAVGRFKNMKDVRIEAVRKKLK
jgi:chromosomal replication initiator protein